MSAYSPGRSTHQTLAANVADTVTLAQDGDAYPQVEVLNRSTGSDIYFTVNGSVPTVGGDNTFIVSAGQSLVVQARNPSLPGTSPQVSLISSGAAAYSVTAV
jgi:hypothetical protein